MASLGKMRPNDFVAGIATSPAAEAATGRTAPGSWSHALYSIAQPFRPG